MYGYTQSSTVQQYSPQRLMIADASRKIECRLMLGRLSEHLIQMEKSARAAREIVQSAISEIDATRTAQLPTARVMISVILHAAGNQGLTRSDIMAGVKRDFGVPMTPNTATTTLLRMQKARLAFRRGRLWFLTQEALNMTG
jgi:hypothetical protein